MKMKIFKITINIISVIALIFLGITFYLNHLDIQKLKKKIENYQYIEYEKNPELCPIKEYEIFKIKGDKYLSLKIDYFYIRSNGAYHQISSKLFDDIIYITIKNQTIIYHRYNTESYTAPLTK